MDLLVYSTHLCSCRPAVCRNLLFPDDESVTRRRVDAEDCCCYPSWSNDLPEAAVQPPVGVFVIVLAVVLASCNQPAHRDLFRCRCRSLSACRIRRDVCGHQRKRPDHPGSQGRDGKSVRRLLLIRYGDGSDRSSASGCSACQGCTS